MWNATIGAEELANISSLAIKRCEGTQIGKVNKRSRSSIYKLAHICATSGKAVKANVDYEEGKEYIK